MFWTRRGPTAQKGGRAALAARGGDVDVHGLFQGVDGHPRCRGGAGVQAAHLHGRGEARRRRRADGRGAADDRRLRRVLRKAARLRRAAF